MLTDSLVSLIRLYIHLALNGWRIYHHCIITQITQSKIKSLRYLLDTKDVLCFNFYGGIHTANENGLKFCSECVF